MARTKQTRRVRPEEMEAHLATMRQFMDSKQNAKKSKEQKRALQRARAESKKRARALDPKPVKKPKLTSKQLHDKTKTFYPHDVPTRVHVVPMLEESAQEEPRCYNPGVNPESPAISPYSPQYSPMTGKMHELTPLE